MRIFADQGEFMTTPDPDSNEARLARHRALFSLGPPPNLGVVEKARLNGLTSLALENSQHQLRIAIGHLHALLNTQRTATQSWEAEGATRDWLRSIGSEVP